MTDFDRVTIAYNALEAALDLKAEEPTVLDVSAVSSFADTFILLTGRSHRHVCSIADAVEDRLRAHGERALGIEGYDEGRWILMDFADLIVHIFIPDVRVHYDLERLWSDAPSVDLGVPTPATPASSSS